MCNKINIISPVKSPNDIKLLFDNTSCRNFYVYYDRFFDNGFIYIYDFIQMAHKFNSYIYVNFKHDISENGQDDVKKFLEFLVTTNIDGIFINSYTLLQLVKEFKHIKNIKIPFKIIIDSYFDIHNLYGIEFLKSFHNIDEVIITEEIYLKNIQKIKQCTNINLSVDSDNLPYFASEIKHLNAISNVVIKGKFKSSLEILEANILIQNILNEPSSYKNYKLPFKHVRKSYYKTNHFSGEIISINGNDFNFSSHIQKHMWKFKSSRLKKNVDYSKLNIPKINLRLSSLAQIKNLESFIKKLNFNPVYSIEYGEIINTYDLSQKSFNEIMHIVKLFCLKYNINLNVSTPRILIERDFERVFDYVKSILISHPKPGTCIINNIGYFWAFINDTDLKSFPIEIGDGINIINSSSAACLSQLTKNINCIDFSQINDLEILKNYIAKLDKSIIRKKYKIGGNVKIPSLGLCPLNNDSAIISRLSCQAPCHNGNYAIFDPSLNKVFPFTTDGFCRMHMYKDEILENYNDVDKLLNIGINEFVFDLDTFNGNYVSIFLTKFLNFLYTKQNTVQIPQHCCTCERTCRT